MLDLFLPFSQPIKKNLRSLVPPLHAGRGEGRSQGRFRAQVSTPEIPLRLKKRVVEELVLSVVRLESERSVHDRCGKTSVGFAEYVDSELLMSATAEADEIGRVE